MRGEYTKVVINRCAGGFSMSDELKEWIADKRRGYIAEQRLTNITLNTSDVSEDDYIGMERADEYLVTGVEWLGTERASGEHGHLVVVWVPSCIEDWYIHEVEGFEQVHEEHWWI